MLVVVEENYKISVWCREIVDGLQKEARKKRIALTLSSVDEMDKDSGGTVILVGAETKWLNNAIIRAKSFGNHPIILSNQSGSDLEYGVSRVTEDIFGSMREIMNLYIANERENIALYACNPDSASDSFKKDAFLRLGGRDENVFTNEGSLEECFDRFYRQHKANRYSGIVCANDFAAISLIRHLKERGDNISDIDIISYSDTFIAKCTSPAVSTVKANFKSFGQLAFMIVDCILKSENISGIRVLCSWEIIHRDTSSALNSVQPSKAAPIAVSDKSFYSDDELIEMMRIETLLSECDDTDLNIIDAILKGKRTLAIGTVCHLAETAVKYRIKKMKGICHAENRSHLKEILSKYISHR